LVKLATDANPNLEQRTTLLSFTFGDRQDQIIVLGVVDYSPTGAEFNAGQPVVRAVIGGTGKYMGARGQLASTRNADGSYTQVFYAAQVKRMQFEDSVPTTNKHASGPCSREESCRIGTSCGFDQA
jgi:hypothetical protein